MTRRFHPAAAAEIREVDGWYDERDPRVAQRFTAAVEAALADAEEWPLAAPPWPDDPRFRLVTVHGFPYRLAYEITDTGLWVLACAHARRRPGYWVDRA